MNQYNINKDAAKQLFIQILYFGSFISWSRDHFIDGQPIDFITNLKNELNLIGELIISKNNKLAKAVNKFKSLKNTNNYNEKGSIVFFSSSI